MLGYSVEPNKVIERTRHFLAQGFTAFKWFLPCAPKDGEPGIRKNLAVIRAAREAAGPDCRSDVRRLEQLECALHPAHDRAVARVSPLLV